MEDNHAGNSMGRGSASYPAPTKISNEKGRNKNNDKRPSLVKAARLLAASFAATVAKSNSATEKGDGKNEKDHQNDLAKAFERLEVAKRMHNEDDSTDLDISEHKETHLQQMKDKVRALLQK